RRERGFVLEHVSGMVRITEQRGTLGAHLHDLRDQAGRVEVSAPAAFDRSAEDALAQLPVRELRQRRLTRRIEQRDDVLAVELALLRGLRRDGDLLVGPAVELRAIVDDDGARIDAVQHGLAILGRERRETLVELAQFFLVGVRELRAGAYEQRLVALE